VALILPKETKSPPKEFFYPGKIRRIRPLAHDPLAFEPAKLGRDDGALALALVAVVVEHHPVTRADRNLDSARKRLQSPVSLSQPGDGQVTGHAGILRGRAGAVMTEFRRNPSRQLDGALGSVLEFREQ
jgi:hypothetical protein